jgi:hypothetical protein
MKNTEMQAKHKFEEYPELAEMMQEYAAWGKFADWQKFTDALNNALLKGTYSTNKILQYTTKDMDDSYDKGFNDGIDKYRMH